jgi:hypothetical protein
MITRECRVYNYNAKYCVSCERYMQLLSHYKELGTLAIRISTTNGRCFSIVVAIVVVIVDCTLPKF